MEEEPLSWRDDDIESLDILFASLCGLPCTNPEVIPGANPGCIPSGIACIIPDAIPVAVEDGLSLHFLWLRLHAPGSLLLKDFRVQSFLMPSYLQVNFAPKSEPTFSWHLPSHESVSSSERFFEVLGSIWPEIAR